MTARLLVMVLILCFCQARAEIFFFKTADGQQLRVEHTPGQGTKNTHVLILMGHEETIEDYQALLEKLNRRGLSTWIFEWRGQGQSSKPIFVPNDILYIDSYDTYVADLRRFIKHNLSYRPFHVLAYGMGANILMRYMIENPCSTLDRIILIAPLTQKDLTFTFVEHKSPVAHQDQRERWSVCLKQITQGKYISSDWISASQFFLNAWEERADLNLTHIPNKILLFPNPCTTKEDEHVFRNMAAQLGNAHLRFPVKSVKTTEVKDEEWSEAVLLIVFIHLFSEVQAFL